MAFHHLLCAPLADAIDASDRTNQVIFSRGFFAVSTLVGAASIIGYNR